MAHASYVLTQARIADACDEARLYVLVRAAPKGGAITSRY